MNLNKHFATEYKRNIKVLKNEIEAHDETKMWVIQNEIKNSAGNLTLHICGNLQHFMGAILLDSGYQRDRDFEFNGRLDKKNLLTEIDKTYALVSNFFETINPAQYEEKYPVKVFGYEMTTFHFLTYLYGHLNYHLGQINYHRRILS